MLLLRDRDDGSQNRSSPYSYRHIPLSGDLSVKSCKNLSKLKQLFNCKLQLTERSPESGICHKKAPTGSDFQRGLINYQWAW